MVHNLVFRSRETAFERENNNMLTAIKPKSRQITDAERTEDGVVFRSEFEMLRVQVKTPEIVRITATPCEHFSKKERPGTVCDRVSDEYSIGEDCGEYILTTNAVTVYVDKASGAIRFNDPDGREMLRENRHAARTYEEFETYTLAGTADEKIEIGMESLEQVHGGTGSVSYREEDIDRYVRMCKLRLIPMEETIEQVAQKFDLSLSEARSEVEKFW